MRPGNLQAAKAKQQTPVAKQEGLAQKVCRVSLSLRETKESTLNSVAKPQA